MLARPLDRTRARIDDQLLPGLLALDIRITWANVLRDVAVLRTVEQIALQFRELVPRGLFVGEMDGPADRLHVRTVERHLRRFSIGSDPKDTEPRRLSLYRAMLILEPRDKYRLRLNVSLLIALKG